MEKMFTLLEMSINFQNTALYTEYHKSFFFFFNSANMIMREISSPPTTTHPTLPHTHTHRTQNHSLCLLSAFLNEVAVHLAVFIWACLNCFGQIKERNGSASLIALLFSGWRSTKVFRPLLRLSGRKRRWNQSRLRFISRVGLSRENKSERRI